MAAKQNGDSIIMQVDDSTKKLMQTIQQGITGSISESIDEMRRMIESMSNNVSAQTDSIDEIEESIKSTKKLPDKLGKKIIDELTPKITAIQESQAQITKHQSEQDAQISELGHQVQELKWLLNQLLSVVKQQGDEMRVALTQQSDMIRTDLAKQGDEARLTLTQQYDKIKAELAQQGDETRTILSVVSEAEAQDRSDIRDIQRKMKQSRSKWY